MGGDQRTERQPWAGSLPEPALLTGHLAQASVFFCKNGGGTALPEEVGLLRKGQTTAVPRAGLWALSPSSSSALTLPWTGPPHRARALAA